MFTRPMNRVLLVDMRFHREQCAHDQSICGILSRHSGQRLICETAHFHLLPQWVVSHAYCHVSVMQDLIARILTSSFTSQLRNFCERWFRSWNYYYMAETPEYSITSLTKLALFTWHSKDVSGKPFLTYWRVLRMTYYIHGESSCNAIPEYFLVLTTAFHSPYSSKQGPQKSKNANTQWRCFAWSLRLCPSRPSSPLPCREPKGQTGEVDACLRNGHMNKHKNKHTLAVHNFLAKTHLMRQKFWCSTLTNVPACPHFPSVGGGALSLRNPVPTRQARIYSLAFGRFPFPSVRPLT